MQKTSHLFRSVVLHNAPAFVYRSNPSPLEGEIPVFTFHTVVPDKFDRQCRYLATNGYKTLSADELLHVLRRRGRLAPKSVVLTFDDGLKTVWTVAYPILRRYGLNAISFLIPGCIPEEEGVARSTLDDVENGNAHVTEIADPGQGSDALMNWTEIKSLHESGVVEFQSHTLHHHLVAVSDQIFDFVHPGYDTYFYGNIHIPLYRENGRDRITREPVLGTPIYFAKPRMQAESRYFESETVRRTCAEFVYAHGGPEFFQHKQWRRVLRRLAADCESRNHDIGRFETVAERDSAVLADLRRSREIIESKLAGRKVTHLCFPWYEGAAFAVEASRTVGFQANYFGNVWGRPSNRPGDDPFRIARVEGHLLERLPGIGRISLEEVFRRLYWPRTKTPEARVRRERNPPP
jgi:hypothetical protein